VIDSLKKRGPRTEWKYQISIDACPKGKVVRIGEVYESPNRDLFVVTNAYHPARKITLLSKNWSEKPLDGFYGEWVQIDEEALLCERVNVRSKF